MKPGQFMAIAGGVVLAGAGITLAVTNPTQVEYEQFAAQTLTAYLEGNVCTKAPADFALQGKCRELLKSNQSEVRKIIAGSTQRQNFLLFSIYTTELSATSSLPASVTAVLPSTIISLLPTYHFETVGIFRRFVVYQVREL